MLLTILVPTMFTDGFCLCLYGEKAERDFTVFHFLYFFEAVVVVFTICVPSGLSNRLGSKPTSGQENAIAIMVVRVVELGANPK